LRNIRAEEHEQEERHCEECHCVLNEGHFSNHFRLTNEQINARITGSFFNVAVAIIDSAVGEIAVQYTTKPIKGSVIHPSEVYIKIKRVAIRGSPTSLEIVMTEKALLGKLKMLLRSYCEIVVSEALEASFRDAPFNSQKSLIRNTDLNHH